MTRRSLLLLALLSLSCRAKGSGSASRVRCPHCGMLVDERSPFRAELKDDSGTRTEERSVRIKPGERYVVKW